MDATSLPAPLRTRHWIDLRWPEFRTLPPETVALLPVASVEQHGPHLPVSVDTTINRGVVARTLSKCPADLPVLVLPTQCIGNAVEHLRYPGTLTTTPETLLTLVTDIGDSVARAGVKRLVVLNSHGGNVSVLDIACRRIRIRNDILAVSCMWARMGKPEALKDPTEGRFGIHAGRDETSVMLALDAANVDMAQARDFRSNWQGLENGFPALAPDRGAPLAWQAQDLNLAGAVGDAAAATAEIGEQLLDFAADRIVEMLKQVAAFDVTAWLGNEPRAD